MSRAANTLVTLTPPATPIYGPPYLENQTSQLGTIALLAEWLELPDLHALETCTWVVRSGLEWTRRNRKVEETEWLAKRMLNIWPVEGRGVRPRTDSEAVEDVSRLEQPRLRGELSRSRGSLFHRGGEPNHRAQRQRLGICGRSFFATSYYSRPVDVIPVGRGSVHQYVKY